MPCWVHSPHACPALESASVKQVGLQRGAKTSVQPRVHVSQNAGLAGMGYKTLQNPPQAKRAFAVRLADFELPSGGTSQVKLDILNTGGKAQVACSSGSTLLWQDGISSSVVNATGNKYFTAIALQDSSLQVHPFLYIPDHNMASKCISMPDLICPNSPAQLGPL